MTKRRDQTPVTVRDALRLPPLRRGRPECVAGAAGLDRPIRWVHVAEVANIAELLSGGELLLTTGLGLGRTPAQQRRFAAELARRGVAAIVLELGQAQPEPPPALVRAAEEHGLPFVVLRREVRFVEITEAIHRSIVGRQLALLRRGEDIHQRFTELLLEGAGIPEVLEALARTVANPVVLERDGEVWSHATYRTRDADVFAAWQAGAEQLTVPVPAGAHATWGQLIVPALDSPIDDDTRVAAERAVGVIAVALLRDREEDLLALRRGGSFLASLAAGELGAADAVVYADALRFEHDGGALLPLAIAPATGAGAPARGAWAGFCRAAREGIAARDLPVLLGPDGDGRAALVLVGGTAAARRVETVGQAVAAVREAATTQLGAAGAVVIAAGPACDGWETAGPALRETAEATMLAVHDPPRPWHDVATPQLRHLLWRLRDTPELEDFAARRLAPLLEHDARRSAPLLPTLEALCDHGWSKSATARALHVERQSMYHRLARIERLLGTSLDDPDTRAALHVAVTVRRLRH
jgi:purine catabolism regulator